MTAEGRRTGVLFISSAEQPGADTFIHMLLMRTLDRGRFDVHIAGSASRRDAPSAGWSALQAIPDARLYAARYGPSLTGLSTAAKASCLPDGIAAIGSLLGLAQYVRRHGIAVLHSTDRPRDAVACALLGKLTGAKAIIHAHLKCADWMSGSIRKSMRHVDGLIGVSQFVATSLVEHGYAPERVFAVLNAIDLPRWDYRLDGSGVRREFGIPAGAPVIVCAARLFRGKGQDELIMALPPIVRAFHDVRVLIVGRDDRQAMETSFTEELKVLARERGVAANVIFTGQRSDMPALMAVADLFALPSDEEPFGLVFAEAMAMKKPVVALGNGGTLEVVDHGKSGLLSAPGDTASLANNVLALLRDPGLRARMGEYGRRQVEARFPAERMAADVARVYESLLAIGPVETGVVTDRVIA